VVRAPGYRHTDPGFDSQRYQIFCEVVGVERCPLNLMRISEELLEREYRLQCRKQRLTAVGTRCAAYKTLVYL
jgi:hypothetical protein